MYMYITELAKGSVEMDTCSGLMPSLVVYLPITELEGASLFTPFKDTFKIL